ncbi:MAG TPA: Maf family protein [Chthoniobacterales bacterium]
MASASPRRRELLEARGWTLRVEPSDITELEDGALPPRELALSNAKAKALDVAGRFPGDCVIGADTIVCLDGRVYGKPRDLEHARAMLTALSGRVHEVMTGVCLVRNRQLCGFVDVSWVKFHPLTDEMIFAYFQRVNPLDKAGAYAIQEDQGALVAKYEGALENIIGLPILRVEAALRQHFL